MKFPQLGALLRKKAEERNLGATALAERIGASQGAVSKYFAGTREPKGSTMAALLEVLGLTHAEIAAVMSAEPTGAERLDPEPPARRRVVEPDESPRAGLSRTSPEFRTFAQGELKRAQDPEEMAAALDHAALILPRDYQGATYTTPQLRHALAVGLALFRGEDPPPPLEAPAPLEEAPKVHNRLTLAERSAKLAKEKPRRR